MIRLLLSHCVLTLFVLVLSCGNDSDEGISEESDYDNDLGGTAGDDTTNDGIDTASEDEIDSEFDTEIKQPDVVCGFSNLSQIQACVEQERYVADLESVTVLRPPGSDGWQDVQDFLALRLEQLGYEVSLHDYGSGVNVIGRLPGFKAEEIEVSLSAHYDHIEGCLGADDNASGVAGALEIARVLANQRFERTFMVAFWDEEERGLIGSSHYAKMAKDNGDIISAALVLEMIGYIDESPNTQEVPAGFGFLFPKMMNEMKNNENRANFIFFVADESAATVTDSLTKNADLLSLPSMAIKLNNQQKNSLVLHALQRSDHASFWREDYPAIMIGDTANYRYDAYHCKERKDEISLLNHEFSVKVIRATLATLVEELRSEVSD